MTSPAPAPEASAPLTIAEVVERFGLTPRALRFWEDKGLIAPLPRTVIDPRLYPVDQVERIARIVQLKAMGFSLEEIDKLLGFEAAGDAGVPLATRMQMMRKRADAIEAEIKGLIHARHLVGEERFALHQAGAADEAPAEPRPVLIEGEAHAWPA